MANGDQAAAAGLEVFMKSQDIMNGYDNDNIRGDELATHILNGGHDFSKISGKPANYPTTWDVVAGKPTTFPPSTHSHSTSQVNGGRWTADVDTPWNIKTSASVLAQGEVRAGSNVVADNIVNGKTIKGTETYNTILTSSYRSVYVTSINGEYGYVGSTRDIKNLICDYEVNLDAWLNLTPRLYAYKDDEAQTPRAGFFAEDVNASFPEFVQHTDGVPDGIHYEAMVTALHSVCQQQQQHIDLLAGRLDALQERINDLEGNADTEVGND